MKGKYYVLRGKKQGNKVSFVYLRWKLQQDRCGWCISRQNAMKRQKKYV